MAAIVAFFIFRGDLPHIDLEQAIQDLSKGLGAWTYLLVGGLAFLETGAFVGLIAPGRVHGDARAAPSPGRATSRCR